MSWWSGIWGAIAGSGGSPVPSVVNEIQTESPAIQAILNVVQGKATAADAVTIVNAILEGVAFVDPATAPVITLIIDLEPFAETLIESGAVQPGRPGEGQVTPPHGGWQGR